MATKKKCDCKCPHCGESADYWRGYHAGMAAAVQPYRPYQPVDTWPLWPYVTWTNGDDWTITTTGTTTTLDEE